MARTFNSISVDTNPKELFASSSESGTITGLTLQNTGGANLLVNIEPLHNSGEWYTIASGAAAKDFLGTTRPIRKVTVKTASSTTTVSGGAFA